MLYPTETLWAIGCDAANVEATQTVFQIKNRPAGKPLPVLAGAIAQAAAKVNLDAAPRQLLRDFWPGPLTVVLPALAQFAPGIVNSQERVAIRVTASPAAASLAMLADTLLVASSANLSGGRPPESMREIGNGFIARCAACGRPWGMLKTASEPHMDKPSTVVETLKRGDAWQIRILRQGAISRNKLINQAWEII